MTIRLKAYGTSFATRQRARDILAQADPLGDEVHIDMSDVVASPSFLAEILSRLCAQDRSVSVIGASEFMADLLRRIVGQLRLDENVRIGQGAA